MADSKICSKCSENKPRSEYNKERGKERAYCKACHKKQTKDWVWRNREKRREYARRWAAENQDKIKGYHRTTYRDMPVAQKERKAAYSRKRHLERKYGITPQRWDEMFAAQGGLCAICKVPGRTGKHGKLAVDHCHVTGRVRGLLCTPCNISIGILGETPEQWQIVMNYLVGPSDAPPADQ